ncbi:cation transporter [uncultured Megasphaera sp.]|uniref:cation transporter n=1 Tax=Megasphaera massiliensis TaxID=1232428 RepID=UPI00266BC99F|nr:cation transporter [uncultured Megasphaera sp.]
MKKTFKLIGLDCANCAAKIENAIRDLPDVTAVSVNFMTMKMNVEAEREKMADVVEASKKVIKRIEPDVVVEKA